MTARTVPLARRVLAELGGTSLLVTVVVGSGIMAARLSPGDLGVQLLANSIATALGLAVLILMVGPVSGAHLNPAVSLTDWALGRQHGPGVALGEHLVREAIPACIGRCRTRAPVDADAAFEAAFTDIAGRIDLLPATLTSGADDD